MKRTELIELIKEVIYSELPEIISEFKLLASQNSVIEETYSEEDGEAIRNNIREQFRKVNPIQKREVPKGKNLIIDYKGERVSSGLGIMDWFKGQVSEGKTRPNGEFKHNDNQMKKFMEQKFGKKIQ